MKVSKKINRTLFLVVLILSITINVSAQRHHLDRDNHSNHFSRDNYSSNNYYTNNYQPSRPYIAVNIGRPRNYQPYYNNYGRNNYNYRYANAYVHFGPSFGVRINVLPTGYYPFYVGNNPYYYNDGVYYRPYGNDGYEVVSSPLGAVIKHLPSGAKVTVINGQKYYEMGGTFYQEEINEKNQLRYKVVGTDGVLNTATEEETNTNTTSAPNTAATATVKAPANTIAEIGARVDKLPESCKEVVINKQKYYLAPSGIYYKEVIEGNNLRYEVTGNSETGK